MFTCIYKIYNYDKHLNVCIFTFAVLNGLKNAVFSIFKPNGNLLLSMNEKENIIYYPVFNSGNHSMELKYQIFLRM